MERATVLVLITLFCMAACKPLDTQNKEPGSNSVHKHTQVKRFINPMLTTGGLADAEVNKMRFKRSEDDCEKLSLCKLHARSSYSFFAAYELYFVNKKNARLWDHRPHSVADCEQRYGDCYDK